MKMQVQRTHKIDFEEAQTNGNLQQGNQRQGEGFFAMESSVALGACNRYEKKEVSSDGGHCVMWRR